MSTIGDLERKVQSLRDQLQSAESSLLIARIAECPVQLGEQVRHKRTGIIFRVSCIEPFMRQFWLAGNPQRKDGSFGTAIRKLYSDWEKVRP